MVYQRNLRAWLRGKTTDEAIGAGCDVAEILSLIRGYLVKKE